jgi:hypothetical protein
LADLLAAYPTGKNDARKVSNEMLLAAAPQGSLLAKDAESKAAKKERMQLSSAERFQAQRPNFQRQVSAMPAIGGAGQGNGLGNRMGNGMGMYVNQQQMYGMWQQQSMMMQGGGYGQSNLMGMQQPQYAAMGMNGYGATSDPNMRVGMQQGMGMYGGGAYQQPQYGGIQQDYGGVGMQQQPFMDQKTRSRVDAWRQSVMP